MKRDTRGSHIAVQKEDNSHFLSSDNQTLKVFMQLSTVFSHTSLVKANQVNDNFKGKSSCEALIDRAI